MKDCFSNKYFFETLNLKTKSTTKAYRTEKPSQLYHVTNHKRKFSPKKTVYSHFINKKLGKKELKKIGEAFWI